jgi:hypothetical protein
MIVMMARTLETHKTSTTTLDMRSVEMGLPKELLSPMFSDLSKNSFHFQGLFCFETLTCIAKIQNVI